MPHPLNVVTDSELVLGMGSGPDTDSKFGSGSADRSLDPQQVTQIRVATFIEGPRQTNARLDCDDSPRPGNLIVPRQRARVFEVGRSAIKRPSAFDINLRNVVAIGTSRGS